MNDSVFNPEQFLGTTTDETGETTFTPVPVGEWTGQIKKVEARSGTAQSTGRPWYSLDVIWSVLDDEVKTRTRMEEPTVRQSLFLDVNEGGQLAWGTNKNVRLARLRAAVGQNRSGKPWAPSHLEGQMAKIRVTHRPHQETGDPMAEVSAVSAL